MNATDYALIVGNSFYRSPSIPSIPHATESARRFATWLQQDGQLPPENVNLLVSNTDPITPIDGDTFQSALFTLIAGPRGQKRILGRRLYVYACGHGVRPPNGRPMLLESTQSGVIDIADYVDKVRLAGLFEEVILLLDIPTQASPIDLSIRRVASVPLPGWPDTPNRYFYAFAPLATAEPTHSIALTIDSYVQRPQTFTDVILLGLSGAAKDSVGETTSESLLNFFAIQYPDYAKTPENFETGGGEIVFTAPTANEQPESSAAETGSKDDESDDRVSAHLDDPAKHDELGRRPFAEVIAGRIQQARSGVSASASAFMVHIHGPWGTGKSSVLNFLRTYLQERKSCPPSGWVVVEFNAWQQQKLLPMWWTLISTVYVQSKRQLGLLKSLRPRSKWWGWRLRANLAPNVLGFAAVAFAVYLAWSALPRPLRPPVSWPLQKTESIQPPSQTHALGSSVKTEHLPAVKNAAPASGSALVPTQSGVATDAAKASGAHETHTLDSIKTALEIIAIFLTSGTAVVAFSRSLLSGSPLAAQSYMTHKQDPLRKIVELFNGLVSSIGRPVAIFIDDLDRCESAYVVELLEGVQTLFREAPVTYVVAADRKWICASFEQHYGQVGGQMGEPGRPLGYLFLEKLFQVSTSVPRIHPQVRDRYWTALLQSNEKNRVSKQLAETQQQHEASAQKEVAGVRTQEELEQKIAAVSQDPIREQAMRAAAAKQISSPAAQAITEHRLQKFSHFLEPNPRAMKRLVNAFGMHQAAHLLEGRKVSPDALALWTLIELRWPVLAEYLALFPEQVSLFQTPHQQNPDGLPEQLRVLLNNSDLHATCSVSHPEGHYLLDAATIRAVT
jgi:hypothetical protein